MGFGDDRLGTTIVTEINEYPKYPKRRGWTSGSVSRMASVRHGRLGGQDGSKFANVPAGRCADFLWSRQFAGSDVPPYRRHGDTEQAGDGTHIHIGSVGQLVELLECAGRGSVVGRQNHGPLLGDQTASNGGMPLHRDASRLGDIGGDEVL